MKTWGEIGRIKTKSLQYIIRTSKEKCPFADGLLAVGFDISISNKTSKKFRGKNIDKFDRKYKLLNNGDLSTMRKLEKIIQKYLSEKRPLYLAITAYKDNKITEKKRLELYKNRLETMGYKYHTSEYDEEYGVHVYYMKRIND